MNVINLRKPILEAAVDVSGEGGDVVDALELSSLIDGAVIIDPRVAAK